MLYVFILSILFISIILNIWLIFYIKILNLALDNLVLKIKKLNNTINKIVN